MLTSFNPDLIPQEARQAKRWQVWKPVRKENTDGGFRWSKYPVNAKGYTVDPLDSLNWLTFTEAVTIAQLNGWGIGFVTGDGWAAVDADDRFVDPEGTISEEGAEIIADLNSYTERSPSKRGFRILCRAEHAGYINRKHNDLEIATERKYFTVTGDVLPGFDTIHERSAELQHLAGTYFPPQDVQPDRQAQRGERDASPLTLSDGELLDKARSNDKTGADFSALYDAGDLSQRNGDHSRADKDLLSYLAYWTAKDPDRMERLFSASALGQRDKWRDRSDYRASSITYAINHTGGIYTPEKYRRASTRPRPETPAETSSISGRSDDEEETLPDNLPAPVAPVIAGKLTLPEWQKAGKSLKRWKEQSDNAYRWALGDWWNSAREDVPHGKKDKFLKDEFGTVQARNVMNYASVAANIPADERSAVPVWWIYRELGNVDKDKRKEVYRTYYERMKQKKENTGEALNSKDLRGILGIPETNPEKKPLEWWQVLKNDPLGKKIGAMLAEVLQAESTYNEPVAKQKLAYVEACLNGTLYEQNGAPIFHPSVKNYISKSANFDAENEEDSAPEFDDDWTAVPDIRASVESAEIAAPEPVSDAVISTLPPVSIYTQTADFPEPAEAPVNLRLVNIPPAPIVDDFDYPPFPEEAPPADDYDMPVMTAPVVVAAPADDDEEAEEEALLPVLRRCVCCDTPIRDNGPMLGMAVPPLACPPCQAMLDAQTAEHFAQHPPEPTTRKSRRQVAEPNSAELFAMSGGG